MVFSPSTSMWKSSAREVALGWRRAAAFAAVGVVLATTAPALAQVRPEPVEPYYVVVARGETPLLAGPVESHYRVAVLDQGQVLRVDHALDGWIMVNYPAGTTAYVRASEASPVPNTQTADGAQDVRTTVPTRLRAANMESTGAGSWATLLADPLEPLPAGTTLRATGVENRSDGSAMFFRIQAPAQARGFLKESWVRRATDTEVQAFLRNVGGADHAPARESQPTGATPTPPTSASPTDRPASATPNPAPTTTATPPANVPTGTGESAGRFDTSMLAPPAVPTASDTLVPPPGQPGAQPTAQPGAAASDVQPGPLVIDQTGRITSGSGATTPAAPTTDPLVLTVDSLQRAFDEVREQPVRDAEYEELIARFEQAMQNLGDTRADQTIRLGLQARVDLLRLRMDYRDRLRELDEGRRDAREAATRAAERIDWLRTQGGYAVIGRLVPSMIYDGRGGPQLFRVVAVNTDTPRTLAYVRMEDPFVLPPMVGKVVGVRGQVTTEPTVGTRIVQVESVDEVSVAN
ncbi:MAG: hypothetical protein R3B68_02525 [Phycisphaerales bacterium]